MAKIDEERKIIARIEALTRRRNKVFHSYVVVVSLSGVAGVLNGLRFGLGALFVILLANSLFALWELQND
ncbi:MAG TPA: hypothetical protein PLV82_03590 [bacterium]|nr:hypothetical protein [bacterium]